MGPVLGPTAIGGRDACSVRTSSSKEEHMSRNTLILRLALLIVLAALVASVLGGDPWGPY